MRLLAADKKQSKLIHHAEKSTINIE